MLWMWLTGKAAKGGGGGGGMPGPQAYMKQLPVSSWERMGLVIGGMGGANPAVETARNTRATVTELKGLRKAFAPRSANHEFFNPAASNP